MIEEKDLIENIGNKLGFFTEFFETIDYSTNDRVKELIKSGKKSALVVANNQNGGRGRIGRTWLSIEESIAISFSLIPKVNVQDFPKIAPLIAVSIIDIFGHKALVKWPNDLLIEGRKFCGILCELYECDGINYVIVGIGINIDGINRNLKELSHATSLKEEGIEISKEKIVSQICKNSISSIKIFEEEGFKPFAANYNNKLAYQGEEVEILDSSTAGGNIEEAQVAASGKLLYINENAELVIESDNRECNIRAGELSLRRK